MGSGLEQRRGEKFMQISFRFSAYVRITVQSGVYDTKKVLFSSRLGGVCDGVLNSSLVV